jgi:hypothetical protein
LVPVLWKKNVPAVVGTFCGKSFLSGIDEFFTCVAVFLLLFSFGRWYEVDRIGMSEHNAHDSKI